MIEFEAITRKRGNSLWVTIPKNVIKSENIKVGKKINILVLPASKPPFWQKPEMHNK